jgi:osmotically-inducible protein OsmY
VRHRKWPTSTSCSTRHQDTVRGGLRQATRLGKNAVNTGVGLTHRVRGGGAKEGMDDATLTSKVETELFRGASARKGKIDVNAVDGVVWLRGEAKNAAEIKSIEA